METATTTSGTSRSAVTSLLLDKLVASVVEKEVGSGGQREKERFQRKMKRCALAIVSSHISPTAQCEEISVTKNVMKMLTKAQKQNEISRFQSLSNRLTKSSIDNPWSLVHLLHNIAAQPTTNDAVFQSAGWGSAPTQSFEKQQQQQQQQQQQYQQEQQQWQQQQQKRWKQQQQQWEQQQRQQQLWLDQGGVQEEALVRDVVYVLQGVDTQILEFNSEEGKYQVTNKVHVSQSQKMLAEKVGQVGAQYRFVEHFVNTLTEDQNAGILIQGVGCAMNDELTDYLRLIATIEARATQRFQHNNHGNENNLSIDDTSEGCVTLRGLLVVIQEPALTLKTLSTLVNVSKGLKGGKLLSALHQLCDHGDPNVRSLVTRIMKKACVSLFRMVRRWIFDGQLDDPFGEFFVAHKSVSDERLWQEKYSMRPEMIPDFIPEETAQKILTTGKAINFIRAVCDDSSFVLAVASRTAEQTLEYGKESEMILTINAVADDTHSRLLHLLFDTHHLLHHAKGIKQYLLLSQGDFAAHLLDSVGPELSKPCQQIYNHNLHGILESSVRASNAQFDHPAVLSALDVLVLARTSGREGWDVFSLSYNVQSPVNVVLSPKAISIYLRLFNFIWRLKRVSRNLGFSWQEDVAASKWSRALSDAVPHSRAFFASLHECHMLRYAMCHFVKQLEYYFMFEVLECSWLEFEKKVTAVKDLDGLIDAHSNYLADIASRILLCPVTPDGAPPASRQTIQSERGVAILQEMFDNMLRFRKMQEALFKAQKRATELLLMHRKLRLRDQQGPGKLAEIANLLTLPAEYGGLFNNIKSQHETLMDRFRHFLQQNNDTSLNDLLHHF